MNYCRSVVFILPILIFAKKEGAKKFNIKPGDIVKIIAPGCQADTEDLPFVKTYIESLGLVANISENIYSEEEPIYSNTDEFRANDLISAVLDDNIKIIWCIRGGTGSIRIIPSLEERLPTTVNHKIFIGYSDATALHLYFQYKYGWETIHVRHYFRSVRCRDLPVYYIMSLSEIRKIRARTSGLMLDEIAIGFHSPSSESVMTTLDMIYERRDKICLPASKIIDFSATRIASKLVGGNSAMVELSIGTVWEINAKGRIFFLEDIADNGEHIEKRLDHMKQSKTFDSVVAVVFGDFAEADSDELIDFVLDRFAKSVSFPVFRITKMGHSETNLPLPLFTNCEINTDDGGMSYEFCVDNIQSITNDNGNSVHLISKFKFLTITIIGFVLSLQ